MERELTKTQSTLVRLWMFGPLVVGLVFLTCLSIVVARPIGALFFLMMLAPVAYFVVKDFRYRYFAPQTSNYLDVVVAFGIFAAISYGIEYWNWGAASASGALLSSLFCMFFFAPHILFRGVKSNSHKANPAA